jgi:DNA replication protein DnaC
MSAPPPLAPDLAAGLRRLKLAAMRELAPELLITARTQRWAPEELLRTLIDAELAARDASSARTRMKNAAFPVIKTVELSGVRTNFCRVFSGRDVPDGVSSVVRWC